VAAPRRSGFRWSQCRSRQMQAFRSRDLNGLVTWQTAYHPEGVGIDCYGLMRVPEEKVSRFARWPTLATMKPSRKWGTQILDDAAVLRLVNT